MNEQPPEYAPSDSRSVEENLKSRSTWLRLLFMVVMVLIYGISRIVVSAVVVLQFFHVLFTGRTNPQLLKLGESASGVYLPDPAVPHVQHGRAAVSVRRRLAKSLSVVPHQSFRMTFPVSVSLFGENTLSAAFTYGVS